MQTHDDGEHFQRQRIAEEFMGRLERRAEQVRAAERSQITGQS